MQTVNQRFKKHSRSGTFCCKTVYSPHILLIFMVFTEFSAVSTT